MNNYSRVTEEGRGYVPYSTLNSAYEKGINLWCPAYLYGRDFMDVGDALDYGCVILDDESNRLAMEVTGPEIYAVTGPKL